MSHIDVCDGKVVDFETRIGAFPGNRVLGAVRLLSDLPATVAAYIERRRTMALLRRMTDHQLCDIGFDPDSVFAERLGRPGGGRGDYFHGL
jgi:uncharacterized protein YjiS (DUF1127 family)